MPPMIMAATGNPAPRPAPSAIEVVELLESVAGLALPVDVALMGVDISLVGLGVSLAIVALFGMVAVVIARFSLTGIVASIVGNTVRLLYWKIWDSSLQHAKDPSPVVPLSQQYRIPISMPSHGRTPTALRPSIGLPRTDITVSL